MSEVTWELSNGLKLQKVKKMAHKVPFEVNDKTPKGQVPVIEGWNEMRQCLIDNGLMESK
jgi:hypothetical protein